MGVSAPQELLQPDYATFAVLQHFVVPEAQDAIALCLDIRSSLGIDFGGMLSAVYFDNYLAAMAGKVGDVMAEGNLTAEAGGLEMLPEQTPHALFRFSRVSSQLTSMDDRDGRGVLLHQSHV
jgi:hypothetical protein